MTSKNRYPIPAGQNRVTDMIKGSRFIATVACAPDVDAAKSFVAQIKNEFSDATHNCWAYVVGPPGSTLQTGSSDDGEPGGTAGSPMLHVLLNSGVGDVVVVVTRYFGGTKLGRGGLVRSYSGGAHRALKAVRRAERVALASIEVTVDYSAVKVLRRLIGTYHGNVVSDTFGETAVFEVEIPLERLEKFEKDLRETTSGKAKLRRRTADDEQI
jgi:uncharacterized YigZ family protein